MRMSGSLTISISGTPVRLKSTRLTRPVGVMDQFAGIFFHMDAGDADALTVAVDFDIHAAVFGKRQFILGNLVSLGQVGIKVVFARKPAVGDNPAVGGQGHPQGIFHDFSVQHRQHPRHAQAYRAGMGVGRGPEFRRAAAENFASGFSAGHALPAR